ncbi:hypothetical protein BDAP_000654 [Binucleata daphniae]
MANMFDIKEENNNSKTESVCILFIANENFVQDDNTRIVNSFIAHQISQAQKVDMFELSKNSSYFTYGNDHENGCIMLIENFNKDAYDSYIVDGIKNFDRSAFKEFYNKYKLMQVQNYEYSEEYCCETVNLTNYDTKPKIDYIVQRYNEVIKNAYFGCFKPCAKDILYYKQNEDSIFDFDTIDYLVTNMTFRSYLMHFSLIKNMHKSQEVINASIINGPEIVHASVDKDKHFCDQLLTKYDLTIDDIKNAFIDFPNSNDSEFLEVQKSKHEIVTIYLNLDSSDIRAKLYEMLDLINSEQKNITNLFLEQIGGTNIYSITFERMVNVDVTNIQKIIETLIDIIQFYEKQIKNKENNKKNTKVVIEDHKSYMCENIKISNPLNGDAITKADANETAQSFDIKIVVHDQCFLHILVRYLHNQYNLKLILTTNDENIMKVYMDNSITDENMLQEGVLKAGDNELTEHKPIKYNPILDSLIISESKSSFIKIDAGDLVNLDKNIQKYKDNLMLYQEQNIATSESTESAFSGNDYLDESVDVVDEQEIGDEDINTQTYKKQDETKQDGNLILYEAGDVKYYTLKNQSLDQNTNEYFCCLRLLYNICTYSIPDKISALLYAYESQKQEYKKKRHNNIVFDIYVAQKEVQVYFIGSKESLIVNLEGFNAKLKQNITQKMIETGRIYLQQHLKSQTSAQSTKKPENNICAASYYKKSYNDANIISHDQVTSDCFKFDKKPKSYKGYVYNEDTNPPEHTSDTIQKSYHKHEIIGLTTNGTDLTFYDDLKNVSNKYINTNYNRYKNIKTVDVFEKLNKINNSFYIILYNENPSEVDIFKIYLIYYYLQKIYQEDLYRCFTRNSNESNTKINEKTKISDSLSHNNIYNDEKLSQNTARNTRKRKRNDADTDDKINTQRRQSKRIRDGGYTLEHNDDIASRIMMSIFRENNRYNIYIISTFKASTTQLEAMENIKNLITKIKGELQSLDYDEWTKLKIKVNQAYFNYVADNKHLFFSLVKEVKSNCNLCLTKDIQDKSYQLTNEDLQLNIIVLIQSKKKKTKIRNNEYDNEKRKKAKNNYKKIKISKI